MAKTYDLSKYPARRATVIKVLESLGVEPGWELVQGNGYLYFMGPDDESLPSTSVMTMRVSDLTYTQWVDSFKSLTGRGDDLKPLPKKPSPWTLKDGTLHLKTSAGVTTISMKEE